MTHTLPERACKAPHQHRMINRTADMRIRPEHALVYKSFVCLNPPGMTVVWEGNDLGELKCTGT